MAEILSERRNGLGIITLNRPQALNALTENMCHEMTSILLEWEKDENIKAVLVLGAGDRAFCAGGDIIMLHNSGRDKTKDAENFWRAEYALNERIYSYPKPYIALIDGVTMGGGVGLSVHGKYRIAGPKTLFAMPETGIGYFPHVGGTFFLPRLGRAIGNWMGLTGARIDGALACKIGVATHYYDGAREALIEKLVDGDVENALGKICSIPPLAPELPLEIECFDKDDLPAIFSALKKSSSEWAQVQLKSLQTKAPIALYVTFLAMQRGANLSFRECMIRELDLSLNHLNSPDFYEGIRAQVIDKDRNPKWRAISQIDTPIDSSEIAEFFKMNSARLEFLE